MPSWDMLNYEQLTRTAEKFVFPDFWFVNNIPQEPISGVIARWDVHKPRIELDTEFTTITGSASVAAQGDYGTRTSQMPVTFKFKTLNVGQVAQLREIGTSINSSRNGRAYITREQFDIARRYGAYLDEYMLAKMFTGTLAITVNGVATNIDYEIPASHKPTAGTAWSTTSVDLQADLTRWKRLIVKDSGRTPRTVLLNQASLDRVTKNDDLMQLIASTPLAIQIAESGNITRFHGLNWVVLDHHYAGAGETEAFTTPFIADDRLIIIPEIDQGWVSMQRGTVQIPNPMGTDFVDVAGSAFWSRMTDSPTGYTMYYKSARLPVLRVPACVVYARTV